MLVVVLICERGGSHTTECAQILAFKNVRIHWLTIDSVSLSVQIEEALINHLASEFSGKGDGVTKRITVDIPEDIHRKFKMLMIELGTDMNAFINRVVEKVVADK